ncbi:MAG: hypothetical protein IJ928_01235 [Prevotella sp.]|nr:hypothetical protein [Prevotella sp.]
MNRIEIFKTLRRHIKLSEKRSAVYEQNKTSKIIIYVLAGFMILYMIFLAVMFAFIANTSRTSTPAEFFFGLLPFILVIDFLFRFMGQRTPAQLFKPYQLLPLPRYACVETFILSSIVSENNLVWLAVTIPYAFLTLFFSSGFFATLGFIIVFQLIIILNSQNYMLWRTLITRSALSWIGPVLIYGALFLPWVIKDFDTMFDAFGAIGEAAVNWSPLVFIGIFALLAVYFFINRKLQYKFTWQESNESESGKQLNKVWQFGQLDRFGIIGEYIKLEIKSIIRNKNMRYPFIYSTVFTVFLSVIISYTDIYDGAFVSKFFIVYVFIINGGMLLIKIMGAEGNYIDALMVHKENILNLMKGKYFFYCALLLVPFVIMIPTIFMGKYTLLMLISLAAFTAGPVFFMFMQMAVWNKQTIPLNSKLVAKGNVETNWFAVIAEMLAMFAPVIIISVLSVFFSETTTFIILLLIGLAFICLNHVWMKNIYNRFMKRRYENMESFRATR